MDTQRGIENFNSYQDFKGTPSDFGMFYKYGVRGLCDVDQAYEKNYEFLFVEGKHVVNDSVFLPLGQFIFLEHLQEKLGPKSTVLVVGYKNTPKGKRYWVTTIGNFSRAAVNELKETKSGFMKVKSLEISMFDGPCNEKQYGEFTKSLCDGLEK